MAIEGEYVDERFGVWPENARALRVFLTRAWRCLRFGAMGGVIGLDYVQLKSRLRKRDYDELVEDLDVMVDAALPLLNKRDD